MTYRYFPFCKINVHSIFAFNFYCLLTDTTDRISVYCNFKHEWESSHSMASDSSHTLAVLHMYTRCMQDKKRNTSTLKCFYCFKKLDELSAKQFTY